MLLSVLLFVVTLILIITQPKGLKIGTIAVTAAFVAFVTGIVSLSDIKEVISIVWDATLAFIGIILLSMVLDEIGFFEWCAIKTAKLSKGDGRVMFVYSLLLGSFVSALFANDGAALILTPILLAKMKILRLEKKTILAFLLAGGFISDSASLPFVFSNLTNIITADFFRIGFLEYLKNMYIPYIVSTVVSIAVLWFIFKRDIPAKIDASLLKNENDILKNKTLFKFSWLFLVVLLAGYIIGDIYKVPISVFALSGGVAFLAIASYSKSVNALKIVKDAPWQIVWFSIGLYVVVYGLKNAGLTHYITLLLNEFIRQGDRVSIVATGFLSALLSAVMNNLPTIMIMDISIAETTNHALAYANIIGSNLGTKITPFGSLATLLWLHILDKKGVHISFWQYTKFGLLATPPVLLAVLLSLKIS
ncbi:MAG: arsenic transporter [Epsilonproteobacteria bacterium]|nr:arsenic transporter [Campylobacterota bacterium]